MKDSLPCSTMQPTFSPSNDEYLDSLVQNLGWLPSSSSGDPKLDFNQFVDFGPELDESNTTAIPDGGNEFGLSDRWNAPAQPAEIEESSISVSTIFNPDRLDADGNLPSFYLVSNDGVHFAVSAARLRANSINDFGGLLAIHARPSATLPVSSTILNLLLHAIYGLSVTRYAPVLSDLGKFTAPANTRINN